MNFVQMPKKALYEIMQKGADYVAVFVFLFTLAVYTDGYAVSAKGYTDKFILNRGQLLTGKTQIAEATGVNVQKVKRIMKYLEDAGYIIRQRFKNFSLITLVDWIDMEKTGGDPLEPEKVTRWMTRRDDAENVEISTDAGGDILKSDPLDDPPEPEKVTPKVYKDIKYKRKYINTVNKVDNTVTEKPEENFGQRSKNSEEKTNPISEKICRAETTPPVETFTLTGSTVKESNTIDGTDYQNVDAWLRVGCDALKMTRRNVLEAYQYYEANNFTTGRGTKINTRRVLTSTLRGWRSDAGRINTAAMDKNVRQAIEQLEQMVRG